MQPDTHYAKSGEVRIAYQVFGQGAFDLVYVPGFVSNIDLYWDYPAMAHFLSRLGSFCRVIVFDKRGTGLSDRAVSAPTLEERMDDVRAVMDAVGSERAAIFGVSEGGAMSMLFAATYPERTQALVLCGTYAHFHSYVLPPEAFEAFLERVEASWGTGASLAAFAPSKVSDQAFRQWWAPLRADEREPVGGARPDAPEQRHRRAPRAAFDPHPDPRAAPRRGPAGERRGRPVPCGEHPRREARRAARRGSPPVGRRRRPPRRRDGGLPHRLPRRYRARPHPRDRHVHRHRRLDEAGPEARRPSLARAARSARPPAAPGDRALPRARGQDARRRVPGDLRGPARAVRCGTSIVDAARSLD